MSYEDLTNSRQRSKQRLIYASGGKCQICGYDKCYSALEFHHIDAKEKSFGLSDNRNRAWDLCKEEIKKCVLLCSNCHREVEAGLHELPLISSFDEELASQIDEELYQLKHKKLFYCKDCGSQISYQAERCIECNNLIKRTVERPTREQLKSLIRTVSFVQLGKDFGVSNTAVTKWCISYQLPSKKKDINSYSEEDWILV